MTFADGLAKFIVYLSLIITAISGAAFLGVGIFLQSDPQSSVILYENFLVLGLYVVGGVLLLISLLGLLAVTTRNGCVVILYIVALVVMILIEVYLIYYVFSEKSAFDSYNLWKHLPFTRMEQLQRTFDCCGFNSSIPKLANSSCASEMFCHEKIHDTYIRYLDISAIVEIVFVSLQVLTLLAMSFLAGRKPINEDTRAREEASFNKRSKHQDRSVY